MQTRNCVAAVLLLFATSAFTGCGSESTDVAASGDAAPASAVADAKTSKKPPAKPEADPLHPQVTIDTSHGKITLELDAEQAPGTVFNFLNYVNSQHYDKTVIHFVDPGKMILGGSFSTQLERKPESAPIRNEAHNGLKNTRGTIAMSRHLEAIDSATCQFFINVADRPELDHTADTADEYGYCVFGKVVSGMDVVDKIANSDVHDDGELVSTPRQQVVIQQIRTLR